MDSEIEQMTRKEISATARWGISVVMAVLLQACAIFFWTASLNAQVQQHTIEINKLQTEVKDIDSDIRAILVGIEQVKARLGIVEVEKSTP